MNATKWAVWVLFLCVPCMGQKFDTIRIEPKRQTWEYRPMATPNKWQGGGNWNATSAWHLGHTPTITEVADFNGGNHDSVMQNQGDGGAGGLHLATHPEYLGDIGAPGAGLFKTDLAKATIRGPGSVYLSPEAGGTADIIVDNANALVVIDTKCRHLLIKAARLVEVLPTCAFTGELQILSDSAHCIIYARAAAENSPIGITVEGGTLINHRVTSPTAENPIVQNGGHVTQYGLIQTETNVRQSGGVFVYEPNADPSAEAPNIYLTGGGTFDVSGSIWTVATGNFFRGPGAIVKGSVIEGVGALVDFDLSEDWP